MKRTIIGVAVVAGMVQFAVPAQAASETDPVKALQAELGQGKAVNLQATAKVTYSSDQIATTVLDGTIGFGLKGPVASDLGQTLQYSQALQRVRAKQSPKETEALQKGPIRLITSGDTSYVSGPVVDEALPADTSWVRYAPVKLPQSNLVVEALDPATLKTLVAGRTSWSGGILKGSVKASKLAAASASFAGRFGKFSAKRDGKVTYTLWFGDKGLVERVSAKAVLPYGTKSTYQIESETRFDGWGREATVLLPLGGDVIDRAEVKDEVPAGVPGLWN